MFAREAAPKNRSTHSPMTLLGRHGKSFESSKNRFQKGIIWRYHADALLTGERLGWQVELCKRVWRDTAAEAMRGKIELLELKDLVADADANRYHAPEVSVLRECLQKADIFRSKITKVGQTFFFPAPWDTP